MKMKQLNQLTGGLSVVGALGLAAMPFSSAMAQGYPIDHPSIPEMIDDLRECLSDISSEELDHYVNTPLCELLGGDNGNEDGYGLTSVGYINGDVPCYTAGQLLTGYGAANKRATAIDMTRVSVKDPGRQRCRFRMGLIGVPVVEVPAPVITDAKGGMVAAAPSPKGVIAAPAAALARWEIFGDFYYLNTELDQRLQAFGGLPFPLPLPKAENEMWGGNLGARYMINENWAVGGQVGYAEATLDQSISFAGFSALLAESDIEMWAISPFVSYTKQEIFANADLMVDFLYSYGDQSYETGILPGLLPGLINVSSEGTTNTFDLNSSLVMKAGAFRHGPFLGLRYIDGEVDPATLRVGAATVPLLGSGYDFESLTSSLGYQASYVVDGDAGSLVPQLRVEWEHEFEDDFSPVAGLPISVDQDAFVIGAGLGWYADAGWNLVFDAEARFSDNYEGYLFGLKAGYTF